MECKERSGWPVEAKDEVSCVKMGECVVLSSEAEPKVPESSGHKKYLQVLLHWTCRKRQDPLPLSKATTFTEGQDLPLFFLYKAPQLCQIKMLWYPLICYVTVVNTFLLPLLLQAANLPAYLIPVSSINYIQILHADNEDRYQPCMCSSSRIADAIEITSLCFETPFAMLGPPRSPCWPRLLQPIALALRTICVRPLAPTA